MTFWDHLPRPFIAMAPMADVTDVAFRALVAKRGKPDIFWTEFVSADGLYHTRQKMEDSDNPLMRDLAYEEEQRPIVAQMFSARPDMIAYGAKLALELGFDGFDINMGCPDRTIEKQGAGAALTKDPAVAAELIRAAKGATTLPVSVKTRVGYNEESLEELLPPLLEANPVAITLHLRTRKEMSAVPAHWELMKKAIEIRDRINKNVSLIGNGDLRDREDALQKIRETRSELPFGSSGAEGAMLGRAMFGNPWVFAGRTSEEVPQEEKLDALLELAQAFEKLTPSKSFAILKKHIKAFVTGFNGAADLRVELMGANSAAELGDIIAKTKVD